MKWIALLFFSCCLWGASEIGKVTEIEGAVEASQMMKKKRVLELGSLIYVKDTIQTAGDAAVQIEFLDKTLLNLKANTRYFIEQYQFGKGKDRSHGELLEGGFRLFSGSIKPDPDEYNIKTPNAVIGLLGTLLEAEMSDETLYVACTQGRVQIKNAVETVVIGEGMEQFAVVTSYNRRPRIFINPPTQQVRPTIRTGVRP